MPGVASHRTVWTLTAALFWGLLSLPAAAQIRFDLPSQSLAQALTSVGNLANLNVYFDPRVVDGHQAPALKADVTVDEALTRLLAGTRLRAVRVDENTVRVVADSDEQRAQNAHAPATGAVYTPGQVHLAYAGAQPVETQAGQRATRVAEASDAASDTLRLTPVSEVIVSAQKRNERLQDVPIPVTAISAESLVDSNLLHLEDYYTSVPGLSFFGNQFLSIRGISTGANTNPTVGVTIDDVPFGASTNAGGSGAVPDLDPADLARIEVLRGPQGTLYGASSMGGLIKYVTVDPSTDRLSGRAEAGVDWTQNGPDPGYNVRGSVNVPLADTLALRASGFTRRDPGYIDNVLTGQRGLNRNDIDGGRVALLWRPSETLSVKLSALYQHEKSNGDPHTDVGPGFGDLQQSYIVGTGHNNRSTQAYSLILTDKIGAAELTAISGYNVNSYRSSQDFTPELGTLAQNLFGAAGSSFINAARTNKFTQEVRLSFPIGSMMDWLIGAYYTHERNEFNQAIQAVDPATAALAGEMLVATSPSTYTEYAGFTDLTFHVTPKFDLQIGGRESAVKPHTDEHVFSGPLEGGVVTFPPSDTKANVFTYLVTPQYRFTPDLMLYVRLASGYRAGGTNAVLTPGMPPQYGPDKTETYDLGAKADFFDHKLSLDASLYYINWKNIQVQLFVPNTQFSYTGNGNTAKSQGVELSLEARPVAGLHLSGWISYDDAALTKAYPTTSTISAVAGNRLPFVSRFSGNISARYELRLADRMTGFAGVTESFVGDRVESIQNTPPPVLDPAYWRMDALAGVNYDTWTISAYANNVMDRRGIVDRVSIDSMAVQFIRPRTVGVNVSKSF